MGLPTGWNWLSEYWKLYAEFGNIWRQLQERLGWYAALENSNNALQRQVTKLQNSNDQLVASNRRLLTENTALREGASETRGQVEAEVVDKLQTALVKAKAA